MQKSLWEKMLEGDKQAFEQIYRDHVQRLFQYAKKIAQDSQLAEDCIHDLFIDLWQKRNGLSKEVHVASYLMVALRRRIFRKVKQSQTPLNSNDEDYIFKDSQLDQESLIILNEIAGEKSQALLSAMEKLSSKQKEIIHLKYVNGFSSKKIAAILSINDQSVRNSLHRAISKLKNILSVFILVSTFSLISAYVGVVVYY